MDVIPPPPRPSWNVSERSDPRVEGRCDHPLIGACHRGRARWPGRRTFVAITISPRVKDRLRERFGAELRNASSHDTLTATLCLPRRVTSARS